MSEPRTNRIVPRVFGLASGMSGGIIRQTSKIDTPKQAVASTMPILLDFLFL